MHILLEALLVGVIVGILGLIIATGLMFLFQPGFSLSKYDFWFEVFLGYFITGMLSHLIFQWTGVNKMYCQYGNACVSN